MSKTSNVLFKGGGHENMFSIVGFFLDKTLGIVKEQIEMEIFF